MSIVYKRYNRDEIKSKLPEFLERYSKHRDGNKYNCLVCPSGTGAKSTAALEYYPEDYHCHCFSCGFTGDVIGLYRAMHKGTTFREALTAIAEEFNIQPEQEQHKPKVIEKREHIYHNADGSIFGKKTIIKYDNGEKKPFWHRYDKQTKRYISKLTEKAPLYHADRLHNSPETTVYFVEGEKDVETLENAYGLTATSTPNGGGTKKWHEIYNADLSNKDIIIITDNDKTGNDYGKMLAKNLYPIANSVKIVPSKSIWNECPPKGDISDIIQALGEEETEQRLSDAIAKANFYNPEQAGTDDSQTNSTDLPNWIIETKHGLKVHTARLAKQIQDNSKYFFVRDGDMEFIRCFWYDENKGVYRFTNISDIESMVKKAIGNFDESLLKTPDIREISSLITIPDSYFSESAVNADESLICFRNGVLNWKTGEFFKLSSDFRITIQIDADYVPDKVYSLDDAPTFKKYLNDLTEGNEEKKKILLEFAGACLSNVHGYKYKKSLFLIGETDSGKSQYIKLICELLGIGNCAEVAFKKIDDRFQTATTYGKRLIFSADTTFDRAKTNDNFMSFTGGDYMSIEYKGQMPFNAIYKGLLLFSSNKMSVWSGNDTTAAYNRMICIRCDNSIPKEKQDKQLLEKMLKERNVIAYLAIEAFKETVKHGYQFSVPAESEAFITEVKRYNNPVIDFFENCCERFEDAEQNLEHCYKKSTMYQIFKDWYVQNISEYGCRGAREFKDAIMSHLKAKNEKEIIRTLHGTSYYKFVPTIETLNEFREGHTSISD